MFLKNFHLQVETDEINQQNDNNDDNNNQPQQQSILNLLNQQSNTDNNAVEQPKKKQKRRVKGWFNLLQPKLHLAELGNGAITLNITQIRDPQDPSKEIDVCDTFSCSICRKTLGTSNTKSQIERHLKTHGIEKNQSLLTTISSQTQLDNAIFDLFFNHCIPFNVLDCKPWQHLMVR